MSWLSSRPLPFARVVRRAVSGMVLPSVVAVSALVSVPAAPAPAPAPTPTAARALTVAESTSKWVVDKVYGDIPALRTATSRSYPASGAQMKTVIHTTPVNTKLSDGSWAPIGSPAANAARKAAGRSIELAGYASGGNQTISSTLADTCTLVSGTGAGTSDCGADFTVGTSSANLAHGLLQFDTSAIPRSAMF